MISYFRKKAGLTQKILSEKLNISKRTMSTYESNTSKISFEIFYKITKILKLTEKEVANLFNTIYNEMEAIEDEESVK